MTPKKYDKDSQVCIQYFSVVDKDSFTSQWLLSGFDNDFSY
jgi:hypothetical protein